MLRRKGTNSTIPSHKKIDPSHKNISRLRERSVRVLPHERNYKPKVSQGYLEEWLDFPVDNKAFVPFSMVKMFGTWLLWNSKSMAGLDPNDTTIRERVTSQVSVLGTAAGLFLVVAIAGFLVPPSKFSAQFFTVCIFVFDTKYLQSQPRNPTKCGWMFLVASCSRPLSR